MAGRRSTVEEEGTCTAETACPALGFLDPSMVLQDLVAVQADTHLLTLSRKYQVSNPLTRPWGTLRILDPTQTFPLINQETGSPDDTPSVRTLPGADRADLPVQAAREAEP